MYRKYVHQQTTWYDFRRISKSEAIEVCKLYSIEQEAIKTILNTSLRHGVVEYNTYIVASLGVPCTMGTFGKKRVRVKPLHVILGKEFLITVRFDDIRGFKEVKKSLETDEARLNSAAELLQDLLVNMYKHIHRDISNRMNGFVSNAGNGALKKYTADYVRVLKTLDHIVHTLCETSKKVCTDASAYEELYRTIAQHHIFTSQTASPTPSLENISPVASLESEQTDKTDLWSALMRIMLPKK